MHTVNSEWSVWKGCWLQQLAFKYVSVISKIRMWLNLSNDAYCDWRKSDVIRWGCAANCWDRWSGLVFELDYIHFV